MKTSSSAPLPPRDEVRRRFLAACDSGSIPPDVESFVAYFEEPERSAVRDELESIRSSRTVSDAAGATVDVPAARPPASPDGTMDHAPNPGGTVDHVPNPGGTIDRLSRPQTGGDPAGPRTVAGYEILGTLGRGAMGVVYKARQRGLQRLVALKMILSGDHAADHDLARFRSEAEAVAKLQHPGIVQIYEVGEDAGRPFFSLEFVDGSSLDKKVRGTPLTPAEAARLIRGMAEAMDYAHRSGVIHRDLKPANILLTTDGQPKIGDFGLAKRLEDDESGVTRSGTILGTPSYMPPEQAEGDMHQVGPLADVYSLGAILYEMLTGRPPFRGTSILNTLQQLKTQEPVPPRQFQPGVPRDLETICLKCLAKERGKRYASAGDLAADVTRFLKGEPIKARPVGVPERVWRWTKRNPGTALAGAAGVLVLLGWAVSVSLLAASRAVERDNAIVQKGIAEEQRGIADEKRKEALDSSERQRETADAAIKSLVQVFQQMDGRLQSNRLSIQGTPEVRLLRAGVLADLRQAVAKVGSTIQAAAADTFATVAAAQFMGDTLMKLGQVKEAREAYRAGHESVKKRVALQPDFDRARANLGVMELRLGDVAMELEGDARTAEAHYQEARRLHVEIRTNPRSGEYGEIEIERIISHDGLSLAKALLALGRPAEARKYLTESLGFREKWLANEPENKSAEPRSYVMEAQMWLGVTAGLMGEAKAASDHFALALALGERLIKDAPAYIPFKADMAEVFGNQGDALVRLGKPGEAEKAYNGSLANLKAVLDRDPNNAEHKPMLALTEERFGRVYALLGKPADAKTHNAQAMRLRGELYQVDQDNRSRKMAYLVAAAHAGNHGDATKFTAKVRPDMVKSNHLMLQVARVYAICAAGDTAGKEKWTKEAMAALAVATKGDYKAAAALRTDPDLAALRGEAAFEKLVAEVAKR